MRSGFFNSIDGDRKYDADDISNYFLKLISNGVFATPANSMQIQATTGMKVKVTPGWAFINCKWFRLDTDYTITLDKADSRYDRVDRIVLRLDPSDEVRDITIQVKKGDAASKVYLKPLERVKNGVWELSLGYVWVHSNATDIWQSNIVDERANTEVCGYVTGLIDQIDTTNLFAQYDDEFHRFMESVKNGTASIFRAICTDTGFHESNGISTTEKSCLFGGTANCSWRVSITWSLRADIPMNVCGSYRLKKINMSVALLFFNRGITRTTFRRILLRKKRTKGLLR